MKKTTITELRVVITIDGDDYQFQNCTATTADDPRTLSLMGSPQMLTNGLVIEDSISSEVSFTHTLYEVPSDVLRLLYNAWVNKTRIAIKQWGKVSRESMTMVEGIIKTNPYNGAIEEGSAADVSLATAFVRNNVEYGELN